MYGAAATLIRELGHDVVCGHTGLISGEIIHAIRNEQAASLSDIAMRRTGLAWSSTRGLCCHKAVAQVAARELGWPDEELRAQVAAFERDVRRHLPTPAEVQLD